jgi:glucose-6-phosphate isomerase
MIRISYSNRQIHKEILIKAQSGFDQLLQRQDIGFFKLPERNQFWESSEKLANEIRNKFSDLVIVGIGGSSLGPMVLRDIFSAAPSETTKVKRLHICDNVDPIAFKKLMSDLPSLEKTAWLVISKSGSTIETLITTDFVSQIYSEKNIPFHKNVYVISETGGNPLTDWAEKFDRPCLEIPKDVGGRYSVLSPVGMVAAGYLGIDISEMQKGAQEALSNKDLVAKVAAQFYQSFDRQEWISFLFVYSSVLKSFGMWWQQLWAESLAKVQDRKGNAAKRVSTPVVGVGASDQHSVLQQLMEGAKDKFIVFVRATQAENETTVLKKSEFGIFDFFNGKAMGELLAAEAEATAKALDHVGASVMTLEIENLNPKAIGNWFMTWQLVVATLGEMLDINAFNQPGVELGKRLAQEILKS